MAAILKMLKYQIQLQFDIRGKWKTNEDIIIKLVIMYHAIVNMRLWIMSLMTSSSPK